mmetsp:Transcript_33227/g.24413  ORF Transcript_33227/g.24413 Transcript_33227/m.24413 type:complete len:123 (+) Transcript_33227:580-948(+)
MGGRSGVYGGLALNRPSFFSTNEYTSFLDRGLNNFSPEVPERSNLPPELLRQPSKNGIEQYKLLENKMKVYEQLITKMKEHNGKLEKDLEDKQTENDKLIKELKATKITVALLEEQTSQREF